MTNQPHICAQCGSHVPEPEFYTFDGQSLCLRCLEENTVLCRECGERIWQEDNAGTDHTPLCQNCYDERYTSCCDCGTLLHIANANYEDSDEDEEHPYYSNCYQRRFRNASIYDYYCKPWPIFYEDGPRFLGVELEIDGAGEDREHEEALLRIANANGEWMYIEHDGPLDDNS